MTIVLQSSAHKPDSLLGLPLRIPSAVSPGSHDTCQNYSGLLRSWPKNFALTYAIYILGGYFYIACLLPSPFPRRMQQRCACLATLHSLLTSLDHPAALNVLVLQYQAGLSLFFTLNFPCWKVSRCSTSSKISHLVAFTSHLHAAESDFPKYESKARPLQYNMPTQITLLV